MSDEGFSDPPPAPEGGSNMRAADLVGLFCLFRPTGEGMWPAKEAKPATEDSPAQKAQEASRYIECDVWTFDRAGETGRGSGVRIGWWKAVAQLDAVTPGDFLGACPKTQPGSKAVELLTLEGDARKAAAKLVGEIRAAEAVGSLGGEVEPGTEVF